MTKNNICLSLHYNEVNSYLFVDGKETVKFKAEDSEIAASPLCLGNISKDWSADNMKKLDLMNVDYKDFNSVMDRAKIFHFITNILW